MRLRVPIVLSVAVVFCGAIAWKVVRSYWTTPVSEAAPHRGDADAPTSVPAVAVGENTEVNAHGSEDKVLGMDRASYDALVRRTWQLLRRGDAGKLAQELAEGRSIDDIRDADLRRLVSAKLKETDNEYARMREAKLASEEQAIQRKIDARMYVPANRPLNGESGKKTLLSVFRGLPDGTQVFVQIFEGDTSGFEESHRDFQSILDRRVKEVTQIFKDHGLVTTWPAK